MKICCLADTQLEKDKIDKILTYLKVHLDSADCIVHLGDGISNSSEFLSRYKNVTYIKGNHDLNNTNHRKLHNLQIDDLSILFLHGDRANKFMEQIDIWKNKARFRMGYSVDLSGYYKWLSTTHNNTRIVVYGHIHVPRIELIDNTWYFCPGGMTEKRILFGHELSMGIMNIDRNRKVIKFQIIRYNDMTNEVSISAQKEISWRKHQIQPN